MEVFEVRSPSFADMNVEQQIDAGINDWCARDKAGREFFGRSREEAVHACLRYERIRIECELPVPFGC